MNKMVEQCTVYVNPHPRTVQGKTLAINFVFLRFEWLFLICNETAVDWTKTNCKDKNKMDVC